MTGITDVVRNTRQVYWRSLSLLNKCRPYMPVLVSKFVEQCVAENEKKLTTIESIPMPKMEYFQEASVKFISDDGPKVNDNKNPTTHSAGKWGLLLPICYRGGKETKEECWIRLEAFVKSLEETTDAADRLVVHIYIGVDQFDEMYDNKPAQEKICALFSKDLWGSKAPVTFTQLKSKYRGKMCYIWDTLACQSVMEGCEYFVLVGDDITFTSSQWKTEIEQTFATIALQRNLPMGVACVCFRDSAFEVFPTFPVIHRRHFDIFGRLFPPDFINQHGDPFLFETYRRYGASQFADTASLCNGIGGADEARYDKHAIHWKDKLLTTSINRLRSYLGPTHDRSLVHCLDVVVPSFRCDLSILKTIAELKVTNCEASVHVLIVVDNPVSPHVREVQPVLQDWTPNHLVRVYVQPENKGASLSRNTGIAQCFGDYAVLLDDDVVPEASLLEAYIGAILRNPQAKIFVGLTQLPPAVTIVEHALISSSITFFYNIAQKVKNPPWGVTANMCVLGRTNNKVWFSDKYPKTGGGEDVEYCLRMKNMEPFDTRNDVIVSVPEAKVQHPFWNNILGQVVGWARGDVKCLEALPHSAFYALPNWIESILVAAVLAWVLGWQLHTLFCILVSIVTADVILSLLTVFPRTPTTHNFALRLIIGLLAVLPAMSQDVARLYYKISRGYVNHVFLNFDWMDGQGDHVAAIRFSHLVRMVVYVLFTNAAMPFMTNGADGSIASVASIVSLLVIGVLWGTAQYFNVHATQHEYIRTIKPLLTHDVSSGAPQPFVVLAYQRTGSNLLCGMLHNHPDIYMHSEVFNEAKIYSYSNQNESVEPDAEWDAWDIFKRNQTPRKFLVDLFRHVPLYTSPTHYKNKNKNARKAVGFKLFPEHWRGMNADCFQQMLVDPTIKKVILKREDLLAVYASKLRADKVSGYLGVNLDSVPITINPAALQDFAVHYDACYKYYEQFLYGQNVFRVSYEQLTGADAAKNETTMRNLLTFLGVNSATVPRALDQTVKQSTEPLEEGIVNFTDVKVAFEHTKYGKINSLTLLFIVKTYLVKIKFVSFLAHRYLKIRVARQTFWL